MCIRDRYQRRVHGDSRDTFPGCIHPIRDQEKCGASWAFSTTGALSDRLCAFSLGRINVVLSPQTLISCDTTDQACDGGHIDRAWLFLEKYGTVSDSCFSYYSSSGIPFKCPYVLNCDDFQPVKVYSALRGKSRAFVTPSAIKTSIFDYGSLAATFQVYQDFMSYEGGIYHHVAGQLVGTQFVKIIGWGQENGVNYWIVANSWGTSWGEQGYFRIREGECGIDKYAVAGIASIYNL
eukprot:TRINITY_DN2633_c0_g1_i2.p1 TRINITY_DN2633_c0_g1~~TRINITY_DN2633_c0_g1_i2.p1  ORF type:complete len:256 (+),score=37.13 TRINITY_DN2633_c0_g1_i2:61-768(+)